LVEGTESLIVGDFADIEAATNIVEATVIGNYEEQGEEGRIEEAVIVGIIHDKDKKPMSGDDFAIGDHAMVVAPLLKENSNMIVVATSIAEQDAEIDNLSIAEQDAEIDNLSKQTTNNSITLITDGIVDKSQSDMHFKCSKSDCYKSYVDEECSLCIREYGLRDMHYCEDHALHFTHNLTKLELILADSKSSFAENRRDRIDDDVIDQEINNTLALSIPKALPSSKLSAEAIESLNSNGPYIEHKDNFDPEVESEENDKSSEPFEHLQLFALLKSVREVFIFHNFSV
jgi:hypothetical protein